MDVLFCCFCHFLMMLRFYYYLFIISSNIIVFLIWMSTITVIRVDTADSRGSVEAYLADARRTVAGGTALLYHFQLRTKWNMSLSFLNKTSARHQQERDWWWKSKVKSPCSRRDIVEAFGISRSYAYVVGKSGRCIPKSRGGARNVKLTNEASSILTQKLIKTHSDCQRPCEGTQKQGYWCQAFHCEQTPNLRSNSKTGQPNFTFKRLIVHHDSRDSVELRMPGCSTSVIPTL